MCPCKRLPLWAQTVTDVIVYELLRRLFHIGNFRFWVPFLKQLSLRNYAVDFVEICKVYVWRMIIKVAKRILIPIRYAVVIVIWIWRHFFWNTVYIIAIVIVRKNNRGWRPAVVSKNKLHLLIYLTYFSFSNTFNLQLLLASYPILLQLTSNPTLQLLTTLSTNLTYGVS